MNDSSMASRGRARVWRWLAGGLAVAFGLATLVAGGLVLFGGTELARQAGHVVRFVLTFNFAAGFFYVAAGVGITMGRTWSLWLARALAVASLLVLAAFGVHVLQGGAFEMRTVVAMSFRTLFWAAQALTLPSLLRRSRAD